MPVRWTGPDAEALERSGASFHGDGGDPLIRIRAWPHRSLPLGGFAAFIGATFGLMLLPLLAVIGTAVLWGLLPFSLGTLALVWVFLRKSYRDGEVLEEVRLWTDRVVLTRQDRGGARRVWEADPHWVSLHLYPDEGPVEDYLTLKGAGREVELGAFLSPEERADLHASLSGIWPVLRATAVAPGRAAASTLRTPAAPAPQDPRR